MKKSTQIIATTTGILTALTAVTGCGTSSSNTAGLTQAATQSGKQPVTVTFWYGVGSTLSSDIQQMVAEFNQSHPGIHVVATYEGSYSGGGAEQQKLLAAIKAGSPPDIAQIEVHAMPLFASSGKLVNLTPLMQQSRVDAPDNFLQGMLVSTQYQGNSYGVPFNRSVPVLYYNKTLFAQAGIAHPPTNWTEMSMDAAKLTHGSGNSKVYGFEPLVDWWPWEYAVESSGGTILNASGTKATFGQANALGILNAEDQLVKQGDATVETGPNYWTLMTEDFIHGRVAMDIDSIGSAGTVTQGVGTNFQWGTALLPKDATLAVPPGGGDMAIFNTSTAQVQAAWQFIQWWTSPAQSAKWSMETGYLPVQKAVLQDPTYQDFLKQHPQFTTAIKELKDQVPSPSSPNYLAVLQGVQQGLQGIFDEGKPVATTMQQVALQADSNLN
ncbi:ABC transporter substrate-binding protein [Alicyclobacillaceae bacterium I2511]|nr:ABC transporter substrate-binding protein [Alicyclobacillaceae bacterium I2511]